MQNKAGFGVGAFLLVAGFVWIVFDNLALGLIFGLIAGGTAAARHKGRSPADDAAAGRGTSEQRFRFAHSAEETTRFGELELRTFRDLLMRPRGVLIAYLERGPTAGGAYARPFGSYLALCGVLMFYMSLMGGLKGVIEMQPADDF